MKLAHVALGLIVIGVALFCSACSNSHAAPNNRHRVVTLYSADGHAIKSWTLDNKCGCTDDFNGGWDMFKIDGERVKISGTIISEVQ